MSKTKCAWNRSRWSIFRLLLGFTLLSPGSVSFAEDASEQANFEGVYDRAIVAVLYAYERGVPTGGALFLIAGEGAQAEISNRPSALEDAFALWCDVKCERVPLTLETLTVDHTGAGRLVGNADGFGRLEVNIAAEDPAPAWILMNSCTTGRWRGWRLEVDAGALTAPVLEGTGIWDASARGTFGPYDVEARCGPFAGRQFTLSLDVTWGPDRVG